MSVSIVMRQSALLESARLSSRATTFPVWLMIPLNMIVWGDAEGAYFVFSESHGFFLLEVEASGGDAFEHGESLAAECVRSGEEDESVDKIFEEEGVR